MKNGRQQMVHTMVVLAVIGLSLLAAGACSNTGDETVDLLNDSKVGLAHLNDEFHTIKGEDLLASPTFGLAHLNDEFHTIKQMLADLPQQVESLQAQQ